ncbi:hypothetical protein BTHERMOSOX_1215 [Bathymodiolus thermophilus thioautotrophic gill symbiont]|nr:hypothetical protein BTHERMOSOX_1215 [Bathymodiolus thermophilus thioautotrophic gill symbiont]
MPTWWILRFKQMTQWAKKWIIDAYSYLHKNLSVQQLNTS